MSLTPKAFLHQFLRPFFLRMFLSISQKWMYLKKIIAYKTKTMTLLFSSWLTFPLESFFPSPQLSEPGSEKLFPDLKMSSTALANQSKIWLLFKPQVEDTDGKEGEKIVGGKKIQLPNLYMQLWCWVPMPPPRWFCPLSTPDHTSQRKCLKAAKNS